MKTEEAAIIAGVAGLVGGIAALVLTRQQPAPVVAVKPKPAVGRGLSFPFLDDKDYVDPNGPFLQ